MAYHLILGDRVKLTDAAVSTFAHGRNHLEYRSRMYQRPKSGYGFDWKDRRGTVVRLPKHHAGMCIGIRWDNRKSDDYWPERALEKV